MESPEVFQVIVPGEEAQPDALGLWSAASGRAYEGSRQPPGIVWRADLPADPQEAAWALNVHALALSQAGQALSAAGPLLAYDLLHMSGAAAASPAATPSAFGLPPEATEATAPLTQPGRRDVLAQALSYDPQEVSFGSLKDELEEAVQAVNRFTTQVHRLVDQYALVESSSGGRMTARTRVDWLGDVHTWWAPGSGLPDSALIGGTFPSISHHRQVLAQALETRQAWLRFVGVLTSGAAKVGLAMAAGPFAPVAIWTAWNYIQKVIEQYRSLSAAMKTEI